MKSVSPDPWTFESGRVRGAVRVASVRLCLDRLPPTKNYIRTINALDFE